MQRKAVKVGRRQASKAFFLAQAAEASSILFEPDNASEWKKEDHGYAP